MPPEVHAELRVDGHYSARLWSGICGGFPDRLGHRGAAQAAALCGGLTTVSEPHGLGAAGVTTGWHGVEY